mmetsp:Transcript_41750/g.132817  ORF Transcript_41750/g.132817 Transcript_41750/m.132817 type:complete len:223 (+) Transcript_41750:2004-2672(+)
MWRDDAALLLKPLPRVLPLRASPSWPGQAALPSAVISVPSLSRRRLRRSRLRRPSSVLASAPSPCRRAGLSALLLCPWGRATLALSVWPGRGTVCSSFTRATATSAMAAEASSGSLAGASASGGDCSPGGRPGDRGEGPCFGAASPSGGLCVGERCRRRRLFAGGGWSSCAVTASSAAAACPSRLGDAAAAVTAPSAGVSTGAADFWGEQCCRFRRFRGGFG